jgi:hypothetical protein
VPTYLVEQYWPGATSERFIEALEGCRRVLEQMNAEGTRIRQISCTLISRKELVFSAYEGPPAIAAQQLNERTGIPVIRIVEAIVIVSGSSSCI